MPMGSPTRSRPSSIKKTAASAIDDAVLGDAVDAIVKLVDPFSGGLGAAPKFPREPVLAFLASQAARNGNKRALNAVRLTLSGILAGGIRDHVGGGFHRYAIDNEWLVPHFEKMLTTQAQMADVLVEAWRLTGYPSYRTAAMETLDYVVNDMQAPDGGFYAAEDAESEGREGKFYIWTEAELQATLSESDLPVAIAVFGASEAGNFEGANILHYPDDLPSIAKNLGLKPDALEEPDKQRSSNALSTG